MCVTCARVWTEEVIEHGISSETCLIIGLIGRYRTEIDPYLVHWNRDGKECVYMCVCVCVFTLG